MSIANLEVANSKDIYCKNLNTEFINGQVYPPIPVLGNYITNVIYRPGSTTIGNIFSNWNDLKTYIQSVHLNSTVNIFIDDRLSSAVILSDLNCERINFFPAYLYGTPTMIFSDGLIMTNIATINNMLVIIDSVTISCFNYTSNSITFFNNCVLKYTSTANVECFDISGKNLRIVFNSSFLDNTLNSSLDFFKVDSGSNVNIILKDIINGSNFENRFNGTSGNVTFTIDSSYDLPISQNNFSGSLSSSLNDKAKVVHYNNGSSGLSANNVQDAIDEISGSISGNSANVPNTLVLRDNTGSFSAENINSAKSKIGGNTTIAVDGNLSVIGSTNNYLTSTNFYNSNDQYPILQILPFDHENVSINIDSYFDGSQWSASASNVFQINKQSTELQFSSATGLSQGSPISWNVNMRAKVDGTVDISSLSINNNTYRLPITDGINGDMLKTDGSGNVSWFSHSSLSIYNDQDLFLPANTDQVVTFTQTEFTDPTNSIQYSNGDSKIIINVSGQYLVNWCLWFASTKFTRRAYIGYNGNNALGNFLYAQQEMYTDSNVPVRLSSSSVIYFNAGDYLELVSFCDNDTFVSSTSKSEYARLQITKMTN